MLMPIMISMTRFYHNSNLYRRFESVLHHNSPAFFPAFLFLLLFSLFSCEESPTSIGKELLPPEDFVNVKTTDTLEVNSYTQYIDSTVTNNRTYSYLGRIYDPYFGDTRNDFVSQLRITKKWPGGGAFTVDSVRLYMSIAGAKGTLDSSILRQISLYEITEMLISDVKYYSNRDPNAGMNVGTFNLPPIGKDTTATFTVPLPRAFGEYLMRDTTKLTQDDPANDFREFFKGLYISMVDNPDPLLVAIDLTTTNFFISVYYTNSSSGKNYFDFVINPNSVRYNRYAHDLTTADPAKKINHINDGVKDTVVYLQAFNGVFPRLKMPDLTFFRTMLPVSVNKASLTFSVYLDDVIYKNTTLPPQILMKYTKNDTIKYVVPDYQVGAAFFDGKYNSVKNTYTFNLASFIQEYLEGRITDPVVDMYYPEGEYKNAIMKTSTSTSPVKFQFTYTRF
jgi:hypothetical protein